MPSSSSDKTAGSDSGRLSASFSTSTIVAIREESSGKAKGAIFIRHDEVACAGLIDLSLLFPDSSRAGLEVSQRATPTEELQIAHLFPERPQRSFLVLSVIAINSARSTNHAAFAPSASARWRAKCSTISPAVFRPTKGASSSTVASEIL